MPMLDEKGPIAGINSVKSIGRAELEKSTHSIQTTNRNS